MPIEPSPAGGNDKDVPTGGNPKVDENTRATLQSIGISQGEDGNFYENGKVLTNPKTGQPMNEEDVKAYANAKKPGSFPDQQLQPSPSGDGSPPPINNAGKTPAPE